MAVQHTIDAALLLNRVRETNNPKISPLHDKLQLEDGRTIPVHHYPAQSDTVQQSENAGWVLFLHGMNYGGHNEPRIINLCSAIAERGYHVLSPHIDEIANFWLSFQAIDTIAATVKAVADNKKYAPNRKLSLMSLSLTGTLSLHAAAKSHCAENLSGIMLFGSFSDTKTFIPHVLSNECTQEYPKAIVIKNLLQLSGADPRLIQALHLYINDLYQDIPVSADNSECKKYLQQLSDPSLELESMQIINNLHSTDHYIQNYATELNLIDKKFTAMDFPQNLDFPVTLMHGEDDNTIIADESLLLQKKLMAGNSSADVLITPLIESHSNFNPSIKTVWEFVKMSHKMGKFLSSTNF